MLPEAKNEISGEEYSEWFSTLPEIPPMMCQRGHNREASDYVEHEDKFMFICDECKAEWELSHVS